MDHLMTRRCPGTGLVAVVVLVGGAIALSSPQADKAPASRTFLFTYGTTVTDLKPGQRARVWVPVPPSNAQQHVARVVQKLPGKWAVGFERQFQNKLLYVEAAADDRGQVALSVTYRVERKEVKADAATGPVAKEELERFLRPETGVPIGGKPAEKLLKGKELPDDPMKRAKVLYDLVNRHMTYSKKGTGWGRGDAEWACDSRYGNCTDFHSLFISLARTEKIPAKFEIGFAVPPKRGKGAVPGYHCWAWFRPEGRGWVPVDISQANTAPANRPDLPEYFFGNLTADRVAFSTGRDLTLVPRQDGPPVNFLIYPYVEVGGRPYPAGRVHNQFTYEDVAAGGT